MGFMIRSLTGDWKFWIYFDVDMKLTYIEEFLEKISVFESTSAIVKSITCDQAGENRYSIYIRTVNSTFTKPVKISLWAVLAGQHSQS